VVIGRFNVNKVVGLLRTQADRTDFSNSLLKNLARAKEW
jgi:hypothetical protein